MRIAAAIMGGIAGMASVLLAAIAFYMSDAFSKLIDPENGLQGPAFLVMCGLLLCISSALAYENPNISFLITIVAMIAGIAGFLVSSWIMLVIPIAGGAFACLMLGVSDQHGVPAITWLDRQGSDQ